MLNVTDLHVAYGQSEALHGISFEGRANETVAVMGRNGMGKTTLFKSLMGILPIKSGRVEVAGQDVTRDESFRRVAKGIAYVPQGRMIFPTSPRRVQRWRTTLASRPRRWRPIPAVPRSPTTRGSRSTRSAASRESVRLDSPASTRRIPTT